MYQNISRGQQGVWGLAYRSFINLTHKGRYMGKPVLKLTVVKSDSVIKHIAHFLRFWIVGHGNFDVLNF